MICSQSILFIIAAAFIIFIYYLIYERIKFIKKVNLVPGPPTLPLIGNITDFISDSAGLWVIFRKMHAKYNNIYRWWNGYEAIFVITSPDDVEQILSSNEIIEKSRVYIALETWLKKGLLTNEGTKWHQRRKILTPAFHFNILQKFIPTFVEHSNNLIALLQEEVDKIETNTHSLIANTALGIICETAMGTHLDMKNVEHRNYIKALKRFGEIVVYRLLRPWLFFHITWRICPTGWEEYKILKTLHRFSKSIINTRQSMFNADAIKDENEEAEDRIYKSKKKLAMLDLLLSEKAAGVNIDDKGIHEEVDTFIFEGHDTVTTSLCFSLMLFACHKNIQDQVVDEINEILDGNRWPPTYKDLQSMQYLERCIKESLRLYPSVPHMSRNLNIELKTKSGYVIPAGSIVIMHSYDLHRNPDIYPDPEKFDPDRFLPENTIGRHPYAYVPFSAGPRNCIGQRFAMMEMKIILSAILKHFILDPVTTPADVEIVCHLVLKTKNDIKVRFRPRLINNNS